MRRYFLEVAYKGTAYSGFQVQENAQTIQSEIEKAIAILQRDTVTLTGSSRTDAGVHALQNFFHFDSVKALHPQFVYKLNAILPPDIAVHNLLPVPDTCHARFDAQSREYEYRLHRFKSPFVRDSSFFFPYSLDLEEMQQAAASIMKETNFFAFAKTNTQVKNFNCTILQSRWEEREEQLVYTVEANRFLRGMVRALTATFLKMGRGKFSRAEFHSLFTDDRKCGFAVPAHGLFLKAVKYPSNYFPVSGLHFRGF